MPADEIARGVPPENARLAARRAFGGVDQIKTAYRDQRGLPGVDALAQDLRFAARLLRRDPRFGIVTIGSLALSIGAISFVFSAVNALVLRPLPLPDPEALYFVQSGGATWSFPDYRDLRDRNASFSALVGYRIAPASTAIGLVMAMGSGSVFSSLALGVSPREPAMLLLLVTSVVAIAVASCWGPVRRSLRVDPVAVLRQA